MARIHALTPPEPRYEFEEDDPFEGSPVPTFVSGEKGSSMKKKKKNNQAAINPSSVSVGNRMSPRFKLRKISPLTPNQTKTFEAYDDGKNIMAHGYAGTGKTFISLYLALREVLTEGSKYDKIVIIRSVVPSRDIGFLPGNYLEKIRIYEEPYKEICDDLFGEHDGYDMLKQAGIVEFTTTSFLRGMTFNNAIVIVDELQNMVFQEIDTIMTRLGNNSKIVFCGDFRQTDLTKDAEKGGLRTFMSIVDKMSDVTHIEFDINDIVRSGIVKQYIIEKTHQGL